MSTPDSLQRSNSISLSRSFSRSMTSLRRLARKLSDKRTHQDALNTISTAHEATHMTERELAPPPVMVDSESAAGAVVAAGREAMRRRKATAPEFSGARVNNTRSTSWRESIKSDTTVLAGTRQVEGVGRGYRKEGWKRSQSFGGTGYFDTRQKVRPDVSGMPSTPPIPHFVHTSSLSTFAPRAPRAPLVIKSAKITGQATSPAGGGKGSNMKTMARVHESVPT